MESSYPDSDDESKNGPAVPGSRLRGIITWVRCAPEGLQITLGMTAGLVVLVTPILVYVYHDFIWRALVTLFLVAAGAALLIGAGLLCGSWRRRSRERAKQREQEASEALALQRKERASLLQAIADGNVKPLTEVGQLVVRNSEVVWFRCSAQLKDKHDDYDYDYGELYVTSMRVVFIGQQTPVDIPLGNINAVESYPGYLRIVAKSASASGEFCVEDAQVAEAHVRRAVQVFHRQVDVGFEGGDTRHIPQEVKTAVWQRDGGRCVECGASDYLEYDHIIPHSRGGASTVQNVQLLCRRCNLRKSDSV